MQSLTLGLGVGLSCVSGSRYLLNYDFTKGFPAALTHTRASGATVVDESGNVVWADENLAPYSDFSSGWSDIRSTVASEGSSTPIGGVAYSLTEDATASNTHYNRETLAAYGGLTTISCYFKASGRSQAFLANNYGGGGYNRVSVFDLSTGAVVFNGSDVLESGMENAGDGWYRCWVSAISTETQYDLGAAVANSPVYTGDGREAILIAGFQIQRGTLQPFVATAGSAAYTPRITHDSDGNALGYLHEPQGTNLITKHDGSNLILTNLTRTLNQAVSPSGATDATELNLTGTGTYTSGQQNTAGVVGGTDKTLSVWFKKPASDCADYLTFGFVRSATQWAGVQVNLTGTPTISVTGDEGVVVLNGSSLEEGANGWWRLSVTATDSGNTTVYTSVYPSNAAWDGSSEIRQTLTGDSTSKVYIWGHQLEEGAAATSLIPTYGAEATRQADAVDIEVPVLSDGTAYVTYGDNSTAETSVTPGATWALPVGTSGKVYKRTKAKKNLLALDADALAYIAAIEADGVTVTVEQKAAISTFVVSGKDAGWYSELKRLYLPIWAAAAPNARCLVSGTSGTFNGSVTHGAGFVTGDGSTGYFEVDATPSTLGIATGDCFIMRGIHTDTGNGHSACGVATSSSAGSLAMLNFSSSHGSSGTTYFRQPTSAAGVNITGQGSDYRGIYIGSSTSTSARFLMRRRSGGTTEVSNTLSSTDAIHNGAPYFMARNNTSQGGLNSPTRGSEFAWAVGTGMTSTQAAAFTAAIETMWENCTGLTLL